MRYGEFVKAFKRAEVSNGPWYSSDDWQAVAADIRMFCPEDWENMLDAVDSVEQLNSEIRHQLSLRKQW